MRPRKSLAPSSQQTLVGTAAAVVVALVSATGRAAPPEAPPADAASHAPARAECIEAHRSAQELRQNGKFVEAQKQLMICSSASCPGPIIADCGGWIGELDQATPTLVFDVTADGKEAGDAKVSVDDKPVADWSQSLKVNPGRHVVRVELAPFEPHEENVVAAEGQRLRLVSIKFASPQPVGQAAVPAGPQPQPTPGDDRSTQAPERRPIPTLVYPLLGAGVAGLAAFGIVGGLGRAKQTSLEGTCAPNCTDAQVQPMKTEYLVADIALGVGIVAVASAAIVYFTRPSEGPRSAAILSLNLGPMRGVAKHDRPWGASATMTW
jgi:hypothetical protein